MSQFTRSRGGKRDGYRYSDLPLSFTANPVTGAVSMLRDDAAVRQAVRFLVLTNIYERRYKPYFGGNVTAQLFEMDDAITLHGVKKSIEVAIRNHEPRADLISVETDRSPKELRITVTYRNRSLVEPTKVTVTVRKLR